MPARRADHRVLSRPLDTAASEQPSAVDEAIEELGGDARQHIVTRSSALAAARPGFPIDRATIYCEMSNESFPHLEPATRDMLRREVERYGLAAVGRRLGLSELAVARLIAGLKSHRSTVAVALLGLASPPTWEAR